MSAIKTAALVPDPSLPPQLSRHIDAGCRIWEVDARPNGQVGHIVVWPQHARAAVHYDNQVLWGHWDERRQVILLDDDEYLEVRRDGALVDSRDG
jgi:hypothetical protein